MTIRAVLLDVGDTLYAGFDEGRRAAIIESVAALPALADLGDRRPETAALLSAVGQAFGAEYRRLLAGDCRQVAGEEIIRRALATLDLDCPDGLAPALLACVLDSEAERPADQSDGEVADALRRLSGDGLLLGAVSNTYWRETHLREALGRHGFLPWLSVVVASAEAGYQKPHASLFREPLLRLGVPPAAAVFVGDDLFCDIAGARAAGLRAVQTVQFRRDETGAAVPDAVISHLRELPDLLAAW